MATDRILNIAQLIQRAEQYPRLKLTIRSQPIPQSAGDPANESESCEGMVIAIMLDGADVRAFMTKLASEQGIGFETPAGVLVWLPWPFAAITLQRIQ